MGIVQNTLMKINLNLYSHADKHLFQVQILKIVVQSYKEIISRRELI